VLLVPEDFRRDVAMSLELLLLVLLLATWGALLWGYQRLSRDLDDLARERAEQRELQANLAHVIRQLQQTADGLGGALATRAGKLETLLRTADQRVAELTALKALEEQLVHLAGERRPVGRRAAPGQELAGRVGRDPVGAGLPAGASSPDGGAPLAGFHAAVPLSPEAGGVSRDDILRLAAAGLGPAEIARLTHRGREEIRLLLQLAERSAGQRMESAGAGESLR
jgi:hypothetical protein